MIARFWSAKATLNNAGTYEDLLIHTVIPGIKKMNISGLEEIHVLKRLLNNNEEMEFITIMHFRSLDDVKSFSGDNFEQAYVPDAVKKVLARFDQNSKHFELLKINLT